MPRKTALAYLISILTALALTTLSYWPGLQGPFLLDDLNNLEPTQIDSLAAEDLLPAVFSNYSGMLGRPVSTLSLALNTYFSGLNPFAFKYTNLMIHLINGLLMFWLSGRILGYIFTNEGKHKAWIIAGLASFLWLAHPLNISTVLYAVQRMAQLPTLFMLAALLCFTIGRQRMINGKNGWMLLIFGPVLFGPLAVLSKENGALLPLFILLLELTIFRLKTTDIQSRNRLLIFHVIFCVLPLLLGLVYFISHSDSLLAGYANRTFTLEHRLLTEAHVMFFYIRMILLPKLSDMGLFQDDFPVTSEIDLITSIAIFGVFTLAAVVALLRNRAPLLALGIGWFLISHVIESTVFPLELVFEHRNYMASFGLLLFVSYYLSKLPLNTKLKSARYMASILLIAIFLIMSAIRAQTWASMDLLATISAENHPDSPRANTEIANMWFKRANLEEGRKHLNIAANLSPQDPGHYIHLLFSHCNSDTLPDDILQKSADLLRNKNITAYALDTIKAIQDRFINAKCPAATAKMLSSITMAALENKHQGSPAHLHFLHARFLAFTDNKDLAMAHFRRSFESGENMPLNIRIPALLELTTLQITERKYELANQTIIELRKLNKSYKINYTDEIAQLSLLLAQYLQRDGLLK